MSYPDQSIPASHESRVAIANEMANSHLASLREALEAGSTLEDLHLADNEAPVDEVLAAEHRSAFESALEHLVITEARNDVFRHASDLIDDALVAHRQPLYSAVRELIQAAKKKGAADDGTNITDVLSALFSAYSLEQVREKFAEIEAELAVESEARAQRHLLRPWAAPKPREASPAQE